MRIQLERCIHRCSLVCGMGWHRYGHKQRDSSLAYPFTGNLHMKLWKLAAERCMCPSRLPQHLRQYAKPRFFHPLGVYVSVFIMVSFYHGYSSFVVWVVC